MTSEVSAILREGWNLNVEAQAAELGVNNTTWQIGEHAWLARYKKDEAERVVREIKLYEYLTDSQAADHDRILVPAVIRTTEGNSLFTNGDEIWRLSAHMDGYTPSPEKAELYPIIANGLGLLHSKLRKGPLKLAVTSHSIVQTVEADLARMMNPSWVTEGNTIVRDMEEEYASVLTATVKKLSRTFTGITAMPLQLIHGDFTHPNMRIQEESSRLIGMLDFEFCSADPAILDLATIVLTLLTRSKLNEPARRITEILMAYEEGGGQVDRTMLEVAIMARKLDSYGYHRRRLLAGKGTVETFRRQLEQLRSVFETLAW